MKRQLKFFHVFPTQIDAAAVEVLKLAQESLPGRTAPIDVWIHLWAVKSMQKILLEAAERPLASSLDLYALRGFLGRSRYFLQMIRELRTRFGVIDSPTQSRNTLPRLGRSQPNVMTE